MTKTKRGRFTKIIKYLAEKSCAFIVENCMKSHYLYCFLRRVLHITEGGGYYNGGLCNPKSAGFWLVQTQGGDKNTLPLYASGRHCCA